MVDAAVVVVIIIIFLTFWGTHTCQSSLPKMWLDLVSVGPSLKLTEPRAPRHIAQNMVLRIAWCIYFILLAKDSERLKA